MAKLKNAAEKKTAKVVEKEATAKDAVKPYYEAESWQFSGCGD